MKNLRVYQRRINKRSAPPIGKAEIDGEQWLDFDGEPIDSQHLLISMLLPPAVKMFLDELEGEVNGLCGNRYTHGGEHYRWGRQAGSIVLGNQKVRIKKPRVRERETNKEVSLSTYERFQNPELFEEAVFQEGMKKVAQRDYQKGLPKIASSLGFTKSSVSRKWVKATAKKLDELNGRDIGSLNIVGVIIDGKRFRSKGVVVALGVGEDGKKTVLGIYECNTENAAACVELLNSLERRGLPDRELLFCVDGGKGLNAALSEKYDIDDVKNRRAVRIRCYKHKWSNIAQQLNEEHALHAKNLFWAIRDAKTIDVARNCSLALEDYLRQTNRSALASYLEAKEDLLNIHRLNLTPTLKRFFSTTNAIESLNYLTEEDLRRVKTWRDSTHFQRWLAASCLHNERRFKRVMGYKALPPLCIALQKLCNQCDEEVDMQRMMA